MSIQKREILDKVKEREDYNHRNTLEYFEDYNLSVTQSLFKKAVSGWALDKASILISCIDAFLFTVNEHHVKQSIR